MLLIIIISAYLFFVFFAAGLVARSILGIGLSPLHGASVPLQIDFGVTFILGLCLVATLCSWLSIFTGIGWLIHLGILGLLLIFPGIKRTKNCLIEYYKSDQIKIRSIPGVVCLVLIGWFFFVSAGGPARMPDTQSYHLAAVKWVAEVGVAPGLANLQNRLGANSSWHVLAAFMQSGISGFSSYVSGPLSILALTLVCLPGMNLIWRKEKPLASNWMQLGGFLFLGLPAGWLMGSLGTDLTVFAVSFAALVYVVKQVEVGGEKSLLKSGATSYFPALISAVAAFAITIKFSAAPLVFLPLVSLFLLREHFFRNFTTCLLAGLFILAPFLIRNVIICGYLLYPSTAFDIFDMDWKVPAADVRRYSDLALQWGYLSTDSITRSVDLDQMPAPQKAQLWFDTWVIRNMSGNRLVPLFSMLVLGFFSLGFLIFQKVRCRSPIPSLLPFLCISGIFLMGVVMNILTGPVPRYMYFNIFAAVLPLAALSVARLFPGYSRWHFALNAATLTLVAYSIFSDALGYGIRGLVLQGRNGYNVGLESIIYPKPHPNPHLQVVKSSHGTEMLIAGSCLFSPDEINSPDEIWKDFVDGRTPLHEFIFSDWATRGIVNHEFQPTEENLADLLNTTIAVHRLRDTSAVKNMTFSKEANLSLDWDAPKEIPLVGENRMLIFETLKSYLSPLPNRDFYHIWNAPLSATDFPHPHIQSRGNRLADGYRVTAPMQGGLWIWTDEEKDAVIRKWGIRHAYIR